jgi:hypothetical protein
VPWTSVDITRDEKNPSICTAAAKFDDGAGFVFAFNKSVTFDTAGKNDFVASAKSALTAAQSKATAEAGVKATVLAALNA